MRGAAEAARLRARLEPRARHLRSRLLRPRAGAVPRSVRGGPRLPQGERGQLGPGRHDRARQRAGDRRPRLALGRAGRAAQAQPVVPQDHRFRRGAARRARRARPVARQGPADAGELDRQEPGHAVPLRGSAEPVGGHDGFEVFTTRPDTIFGASFAALSPDHPIALALAGERPEIAAFIAECKKGGTTAAELETAEKLGFDTGLKVVHPLDPDWTTAGLHRQFRADGLRHRRDFRRARRTTSATSTSPPNTACRSCASSPPRPRRPTSRSATRPRAATACSSTSRFLDGMSVEAGQGRGDRARRGRGLGRGDDRLAAARLGRVAPALLGNADPDRPLRGLRRGAGAEGPAAGGAARGHRLRHPRQPARAAPDLEARRLPELRRRRRCARPTRSTPSSIPPGISSASPASRRTGRSTRRSPSAGCRSTSISAGSSMRSCTCSTPASGRAR